MVDLSFSRPEQGILLAALALPAELAVLMAGVAARQATSPTALAQARLEGCERAGRQMLAGAGAFNPAAAQLLTGWREE